MKNFPAVNEHMLHLIHISVFLMSEELKEEITFEVVLTKQKANSEIS